ncbi:hypothetical protein BDN72DRAFT_471402 [Pluteus cervinus]|uniref:Uncharacterized protein n=1 Tax=Pluteus cervinus TaxID=181527 RepID=A0ACD3A7G3_9AGAR|nr:hypothetical protein BDN72DRAFT_471402 [Pluteus cervinus]
MTSLPNTMPIPASEETPDDGGPDPEIPRRWRVDTPLQHPLPKHTDSSAWEGCYKGVNDYDEDMCRVWKDEIDKLLIFAGLFSAAVTSFAVEAYQWLENPSDINTDLLVQLVLAQNNSTLSSQLPVPPFQPSSSAIRINVCWFMSLTLSLGAVLVGILSLQWIREYQRPVSTASFKEKLTYRQIRHDGLLTWGVPQIVSLLPILLQVSLVLFFIGIFDLLWDRNQAVALAILIPIALVFCFLAVSTALPAIQVIIFHYSKESVMALKQCPYKSPQSWVICRLVFPILSWAEEAWNGTSPADLGKPTARRSWFTLDQFWDDHHKVWVDPDKQQPKLARAIEWMQDNLPRHADVTHNLYQCLSDIDKETTRAVMSSFTKDLRHTPLAESTWLSDGNSDTMRSPEIVSALFLTKFHKYTPGAVEHWIRAVNSSPSLFPSMPMEEIQELSKEYQDEFFPQVLNMLLAVSRPITSPLTNYMVQLTLADIIQWFVSAEPGKEPDERVLTRWMDIWAVNLFGASTSQVTKAFIVELAYQIGKKNEEKRQHRITSKTWNMQPQLSDTWRDYIRLKSWDVISSTPEANLWWKKVLARFKAVDISNLEKERGDIITPSS